MHSPHTGVVVVGFLAAAGVLPAGAAPLTTLVARGLRFDDGSVSDPMVGYMAAL